jgi:hypothetical protein
MFTYNIIFCLKSLYQLFITYSMRDWTVAVANMAEQ